MSANNKTNGKIPIRAKVTWIGDLPSIRHRCPRTNNVYLFNRGVPLVLTHPDDILFYDSKAKWKVEVLEWATKGSKKVQQAVTAKNTHNRGE